MRILGLCILYSDHKLSARELTNFFGLDQSSFYAALQWFHSVMDIPIPSAAGTGGVRFYHASFGDFLKNPSRSGKFALDQAKSHYEVAVSCLRWYASAIEERCELEPGQCMCPSQSMELTWAPDSPGSVDGQNGIHIFALTTCWIACSCVRYPYITNVLAELRLFPFCHLDPVPFGFVHTVYWLEQVSQVRSIPVHREGTR
ncbi:hypothetical protein P691DRAFT_574429 [Macrolepiota fuliginosa MF-IS2]|uniref:Uncharacterized protein n=1 Tax=Macrolepiota fuliginosa MF-IS2 TaxID=1400762 RepID=A0A9P5WYW0_9AGAR|nr:hypothetical protein P691DRAFT_574429 [Macrolepiota fuliginosa MF-IS2]